ncbi:TPA: acyltransferase family protein [Photobacterium damselae]
MLKRQESFDSAKGMLILLVILGHVLLGSLDDNKARELLYFFHMPLFLALTGFFVKREHLKSFNCILKRYRRIYIPYAIAFFYFSTVRFYNLDDFNYQYLFQAILYPYYHLWYIPAVILFSLYLFFLNRVDDRIFIFIFIVLAFLCSTFFFEAYGQNISDSIVYKAFGDKRFYYFFVYFYFGYLYSRKNRYLNVEISMLFIILGLFLFYYSENDIFIGIGKTITNIAIANIVLFLLINIDSYKSLFLAKIGYSSLPIYLWHVAIVDILKNFNLVEWLYYILAFCSMIVFISLTIYMSDKNKILNTMYYGR